MRAKVIYFDNIKRMKVIVIDHAAKRLCERLNCSSKKIQKIAEKAWRSTLPLPAYLNQKIKNSAPNRIFRVLMGYTFVFQVQSDEESVALVTVMKRREKNDAEMKLEVLRERRAMR